MTLAGVVYGLTTRTEIWMRFQIPVFELPPSIKTLVEKAREEIAAS
jgi:hypothetical protein